MTERETYIAGLLGQSRNEVVRLNNENVRQGEVIRFLEEEIETQQAEHEAELAAKDEEIASLKTLLSEMEVKCSGLESERDEACAEMKQVKAELELLKTENSELGIRYSQVLDALQDKDELISVSEREKADVMAIVDVLQKKVFGKGSERTRLLDGEIILDGDSSDNMGLSDIIAQVKKNADAFIEADTCEISLAVNKKGSDDSSDSPSVPKPSVPANRKRGKGQAKHKPRYTFTAEVLEHYGIDASNLPAGAKLICRKDKKSGKDVWVMKLLYYHKAKITCKEFEIGRFNVPGQDPMSSAYPKTVVPGNPLMPSFAAFYISQKIGYGMPENRILDMISHMDAVIAQSTLNKYMHEIIDFMRIHMQPEAVTIMKRSFYRQCDEVRITVRSRESKDAPFKYNTEYIHMHLSQDLKLVIMEYDEGSRSHEVQLPLFEGSRTKVFTTDRAPLYTAIVNDLVEMDLVRSADWVHARRCFVDAYATDKRVIHVINLINALIMIENDMKRRGLTPDQRFKHRLRHSRPLVMKIMKLLEKMKLMGKEYGAMVHRAIDYVLEDKEAFMVFLQYGIVEMHNNAAERMFRHLAIGRRNWQQSGSHNGAQNLAFLFSLYESCKLCGIDFETYIEDILTRIMNGDTDYASFIPCNYKPLPCDQQASDVA